MIFRRLGTECHFTKETVLRLTLTQVINYLTDPSEEDDRRERGVEIRGPEDWAAILAGLEREKQTNRTS